ncbi:MAG: DUF1573 domain-containing protein [Saprospiraceae bacterium]
MNTNTAYTKFNFFNGLLFVLFAFGINAVNAQTATDPYLTFETPFVDFGTLKKGEVKTHVFKFTNTGEEDIKIDFVTVGCECTEVEWPETKTFKPGDSGEIKAIYDSGKEEELGEHDKYFEVILANTDPKTGNPIIKEADFRVVVIK